jgi:RNA polymerase primary sigma factor
LVEEYGREPTSEEVARRMEIPVRKVRKILRVAQQTISLEAPVGVERDGHLRDFIEDSATASPVERVTDMKLRDEMDRVLQNLNPREDRVVRMRFGVVDGCVHPATLYSTEKTKGRFQPQTPRCQSGPQESLFVGVCRRHLSLSPS